MNKNCMSSKLLLQPLISNLNTIPTLKKPGLGRKKKFQSDIKTFLCSISYNNPEYENQV
jgi:hypothetical protein